LAFCLEDRRLCIPKAEASIAHEEHAGAGTVRAGTGSGMDLKLIGNQGKRP
jgi:hypothetical protein